MLQHALQCSSVKSNDAVKSLLRSNIETALFSPVGAFQKARTHHGSERERNHRRDEDGYAQGDGKLAEKAANDVAHEEQWDQYRNQGNREGYDGEADLLGALQRGLQRRVAFLDESNDVLDHHDGIINDEARGNREGHQREVVQAEARKIHHPERAHDGERDGDAGDGRRG